MEEPLCSGLGNCVENFPETIPDPRAMSSNEAASARTGRIRCFQGDTRCMDKTDCDGLGQAGHGSGMEERKKSRKTPSTSPENWLCRSPKGGLVMLMIFLLETSALFVRRHSAGTRPLLESSAELTHRRSPKCFLSHPVSAGRPIAAWLGSVAYVQPSS
jgi:hypothetical protein